MVILLIQLPLPSTYGISVYILCLLCLFKCVWRYSCDSLNSISCFLFFASFALCLRVLMLRPFDPGGSLFAPSPTLQIGFYCISLREGCGRQLTFNTNPNKFVYSFELNVNWYDLHMFQSRPLAATSYTSNQYTWLHLIYVKNHIFYPPWIERAVHAHEDTSDFFVSN